jgi:arylsulfatase A-like enzyme
MKKELNILIFILLIAVSLSSNAQKKGSVKNQPNIIYILLDDLGYGDLGCYGQKDIKTPAIDKMAKDGILFTRHYAGSTVCAPSRCVLMTGLHTGHAKIRGNSPKVELNERDTTIASMLKKVGYNTALIGKWGLGDEGSKGIPNLQGFDYFYGYLNQVRAHNYYPDYVHRNMEKVPLENEVIQAKSAYGNAFGTASTNKKNYTPNLFLNEALGYIEKNANSPFFLYLALTLPHANNEFALANHEHGMEVPSIEQYQLKDWPNAQKAMASMVSYADDGVRKIREKLQQMGIDKNTIIIFSSDNGPHAEGKNNPKFFNSSGGLRGIKRDLYEGGIRVPMIVCWPEKIKANQVSNHVSSFTDIMPTLAQFSGATTPQNIDGISFYPTLFKKTQKQHENLYWEFNEQGGKQAALWGKWKLIKLNLFTAEKIKVELYNLETDPFEKNNIAEQNVEIVKTMNEIINKQHVASANFPLTPKK